MSYMVGYGRRYPQRIHHRGSSLPSVHAHPAHIACKEGSRYYLSPNPNPNVLVGAVVGGPNSSDAFPDSRPFFQESEPTTYINAPLVGLLAYFAAHSWKPWPQFEARVVGKAHPLSLIHIFNLKSSHLWSISPINSISIGLFFPKQLFISQSTSLVLCLCLWLRVVSSFPRRQKVVLNIISALLYVTGLGLYASFLKNLIFAIY